MQKENLQIIEIEVSPIVAEAQLMSIETKQDMLSATEALSKLNVLNDRLIADKETITKPINKALKEIRSKYKPLETLLDTAIGLIRGKMGTYQTQMLKAAKEEEARIAARIGEGRGKLKIETAVAQLEDIERADRLVETDSGSIKFRTVQVLKIIKEQNIPRLFLVPNEKLILFKLKQGETVEGCVLEEQQVPINYRG